MARIYTRTGDGGETSLFGGKRVSKADARVDLYGGVDELNSFLGLAAAALGRAAAGPAAGGERELLARVPGLLQALAGLQHELLDLGAILADPARSEALARADDSFLPAASTRIEGLIDSLQADLPPLRAFILPGGHEVSAAFHVARTVCRRVERQAVAAAAGVALPRSAIVYLNRLSDLLFVLARWSGRALGGAEVIWP